MTRNRVAGVARSETRVGGAEAPPTQETGVPVVPAVAGSERQFVWIGNHCVPLITFGTQQLAGTVHPLKRPVVASFGVSLSA